MERVFGASWLTTAIGLVAAVANALVPLFQTGTVTTQELINSIAMAALGWAAKSFNVSGTGQKSSSSSSSGA